MENPAASSAIATAHGRELGKVAWSAGPPPKESEGQASASKDRKSHFLHKAKVTVKVEAKAKAEPQSQGGKAESRPISEEGKAIAEENLAQGLGNRERPEGTGTFVGRVVSLLDLELCLSWTRVYLLLMMFDRH